MKWKFGALLALLGIAVFCIFIFLLPALSGVNSLAMVPRRRPLAFTGLVLIVIWMYLYERHRVKHPDHKVIYALMSKGRLLVPRKIILRSEARKLRRVSPPPGEKG